MKTLTLPAPVMGHCLAYGHSFNADLLRASLDHCKAQGHSGMVIVPAVFQPSLTPEIVTDIFVEKQMLGMVCCFLGGGSPDPLKGAMGAALEVIREQMKFAFALANAVTGPRKVVGPFQAIHRLDRPDWQEKRLAIPQAAWLCRLNRLMQDTGFEGCLEALNGAEEGTPNPFHHIFDIITSFDLGRIKLHWDTGHAKMRGLTIADFRKMRHAVGYFELANLKREPLDVDHGINFHDYSLELDLLPQDCVLGVETFDLGMIRAFGLEDLCSTQTPGHECVERDARYLKRLGIMENR